MGYYRDRVLTSVMGLVASASRRPLLLGIDGQGGSGKSTLARELVSHLESGAVVEGDDFYRDMPEPGRAALSPAEGYKQYFDWQRLRAEVLLPVRAGHDVLRYQRYDWDKGKLGDWVERPMPDVVVVEGIYTLRPQLRDLIDVKVYVRASEEVRIKRQAERGQNSNEWIKKWVAAEDFYIAACEPWVYADLVIDGE